ncbi:OmpW/AlkL family protein [Ramlibacter sp. PS4R-6]|uniref:OmpW/AlkL family protein n=1 Tax=Ramlibacter sp. PS4R-6 TaxID=3133438 RepID=UPI0030B2447E
MNKKLAFIAAAFAAAACGAHAQPAGSLTFRVGATMISPDVRSGDLSAPSLPGTKVDVGDSTQLGGGITYMVTDNIAIDLPLALPFRHELTGDGAIAGAGKIGEVRSFPVTLIAQWRFGAANAQMRPYVGAGLTYAKTYRERSTGTLSALTGGSPTTFKVGSKLAPTLAAGLTYNVNEKWFVEGVVHKTFLKQTAKLSTGQSIDLKVDPWAFSIGVGTRFN